MYGFIIMGRAFQFPIQIGGIRAYYELNRDVNYSIDMNHNDHYESKIVLLDQYAQCLQKQNETKTKEITVLHDNLSQVYRENDSLRTALHELKIRLQVRQRLRNANYSLQTSINVDKLSAAARTTDAECQTRDELEEESTNQINQILELNQIIKEKDEKIAKYQSEGEEMFEAIEKLESDLNQSNVRGSADKETIRQLEERLALEEKRRSAAEDHLQELSDSAYNAGEQSDSYKREYLSLQSDMTNLITQNNGLIQKVRALEKQKNEYYHELKRVSRVSFGAEGLSKSNLKQNKVKDQRWREIEENLRKIQMENEAIHSNLIINR